MEIKDIMKYSAKPILKDAGFRTKGNDWWKEIDGGVLMIHLWKSSYSNSSNGFMQDFIIFAVSQDEFKPDISANWYGNHYSGKCLNARDFLPYYGTFEPFTYTDDCQDFTFRPGMGTADEMADNVKMVFTDYILPYLEKVKSIEDFKAVFDEVKSLTPQKDMRLLVFFYTKLDSGMFDNNMPNAIQHYKELGITRTDVEENMWMLDKMYNETYKGMTNKKYEGKVRDFIHRLLDEAERA